MKMASFLTKNSEEFSDQRRFLLPAVQRDLYEKKKSDVTKNRKELIKNLMRRWQVKLSAA